jgi:hypothetical protein
MSEIICKTGTTAQNAAYTGKNGELTVENGTSAIHVHDGVSKGGSTVFTFFGASADTITTLDGNELRRYMAIAPYPLNGADESAGLYCKIDPAGTTNQLIGIYGEITNEQQDTEAAFMKVVSYGAGDAIYTALFADSGVGFEAASFHDGTKGIISTMQQDGCPNSVLYNGWWGEREVPNFAMAYYDQSPGNAITVRPTPLAAASQSQIRIWTPDISATTFEATTDGTVKLKRINATENFTPTGTADTAGNTGDITKDDNYVYVKTSAGWKRSALSTF